jgi:hypothetical protein
MSQGEGAVVSFQLTQETKDMAAAIREWDEAFLKQRARDEAEGAVQARQDADWERAVGQIAREVSDVFRGYTLCESAKCRRARRCMGFASGCHDRLPGHVPLHVTEAQIEEVYAEIQEDRRASACGDDAREESAS